MELSIGEMPHGQMNLITDVKGVTVGHCTVDRGNCHTGVTVILPSHDNIYLRKMTAASHVINGFGKTLGLVQLEELGTIETPIAITNTLNVGKVHDAMVSYMIDRCREDGINLVTVNPIVCECNDSRINDIRQRAVEEADVRQAINESCVDFEQGSVGAGRGTVCYGLKGGIGSSSRLMLIDGREYTLGVLVQTNYGAAKDFNVKAVNASISSNDSGSIIIILATDLPLNSRQLKRVLKRTSVGMARLGSYIGHSSGEIAVGFTTSLPEIQSDSFFCQKILKEDRMDIPFRAAGECTEEAILQSMIHAKPDQALDGRIIQTLKF